MSDTAAPQGDAAPAASETGNTGPGAVDYSEILARHQGELARTGKTVESLKSELDDSRSVLSRVQKAFVGEEDKVSPHQRRMRDFEDLGAYLDKEALEDQKNGGRGLPITTKIGKQLVAYGREAEERAEKLEKELADIKKALDRRENPNFQGLERAGQIMEGMLEDGLNQLYGADPETKGIRGAQMNAVSRRINEEIQDLMKNDPDGLRRVQRDPKVMRRMVNHFMAEMLPPKVRSMLDNQRIQNEPFDSRDLYQSFAEARQEWEEAQSAGDERKTAYYDTLMTELRQKILSSQQEGRRGGTAEKPSLNQLFGR